MTKIDHIDADTALDLLTKAVERRGSDFVYPNEWEGELGNCQYAVNGEPACIVGMALAEAGYSEELKSDNIVHTSGPGDVMDLLGIEYDYRSLTLFSVAQQTQDDRATWGEALDKAKADYEKHRKDREYA